MALVRDKYRTAIAESIRTLLAKRIGRERAVTAPGLCHLLGWNIGAEREVRRLIAEHRHAWAAAGLIICAVPGTTGGFFAAADLEEAAACWVTLKQLSTAAEEKVEEFEAICKAAGFSRAALEAASIPEKGRQS